MPLFRTYLQENYSFGDFLKQQLRHMYKPSFSKKLGILTTECNHKLERSTE